MVVRLCREGLPSRRVLNLGSGRTRYGKNVLNLDLNRFANVQVCGSGEALPFRDGVFEGVLLRGVLEHVRSAEAVKAEVCRVLRPGGFVYVEVPFLQPLHLSPEDHRRFTMPGLRAFLSVFEEVETGIHVGPGSTLAWVVQTVSASILSCGSKWLYGKLLVFAGWATFWLKYLDMVVVPSPHAADSASAVYFLGRTRE
jgi:SAM-dependent methyltransferase